MLRDRGSIKWTSMMLPEHVQQLKEVLADEARIQKPIFDEQEIEEMELLILEAMEFNSSLAFQVYDDGFLKTVTGVVRYINHIKSELKVQDSSGCLYHISFHDLTSVHKN